jgi:ABC-type sugar transport system ATPase subunit
MENAGILEVKDLVKTYPPSVNALMGITLSVRSNEVTALLGANGAGKSTLARILTEVEQQTSGTMYLDGKAVRFPNPQAAIHLGIAAVHQELPLLPNLTAAENITLGNTTERFFDVWRAAPVRRLYLELAKEIPDPPSPNALVGRLTVAQRQKVAFIRALAMRPRVLIVDEGTSSLSIEERREMQDLLRVLAHRREIAVIYITHFIEDALTCADRIIALRDGMVALDGSASEIRHSDVFRVLGGGTSHMPVSDVGPRSNDEARTFSKSKTDGFDLRVQNLSCEGMASISFDMDAGECLGLYGPPGCGATETLRAIAGLIDHSGSVYWNGWELPRSMPNRVQSNVVYCNGDRAKNLIMRWTVGRNIGLLYLFRQGLFTQPARAAAKRRARAVVTDFAIKGSPDEPIRNLSGGNQQRVAVARAISLGAPLLLIGDDLTRGVDIVGRGHIHQLLRSAATRGATILLYSTDPEELVSLCDRVLVLRDQVIVQQLHGGEISVTAVESEVQRSRHVEA